MYEMKSPRNLAFNDKQVNNFKFQISGINLSSGTVEFDLAALIGRKAGTQQCQKIYARCNKEYDELLKVLEATSELL